MNKLHWQALMQRCGLANNVATFNALLQAYQQKHRFYHNKQHIDAVLNAFETSKDLAKNANAVELALWFHDAVYQPASPPNENEQKSAEWAISFLVENGAGDALVQEVHALIIATQHEQYAAKSSDAWLVVDCDLSILGSDEDIYQQFEQQIRQEYQHVPEQYYKQRRSEVLSGFLARDRIYFHERFYTRIETAARKNMLNTIEILNEP